MTEWIIEPDCGCRVCHNIFALDGCTFLDTFGWVYKSIQVVKVTI